MCYIAKNDSGKYTVYSDGGNIMPNCEILRAHGETAFVVKFNSSNTQKVVYIKGHVQRQQPPIRSSGTTRGRWAQKRYKASTESVTSAFWEARAH